MANYAFMPAQAVSKGVPGKNTKLFSGKPMTHWPLEALVESEIFDSIFVSSDSESIPQTARTFPVETITRDSEFSDDFTGILEVVKNFIKSQGKKLDPQDNLLCTFPTATTLTKKRIQDAFALQKQTPELFVIAVKKYPHPIARALVFDNDTMKMLDEKAAAVRTQDAGEHFYDAGFQYLGTVEMWKRAKSLLAENFNPLVLEAHEGIDIDDLNDFDFAEKMIRVSKP